MKLTKQYTDMLGYYHLPEDGNDYADNIRPKVALLEAIAEAAAQVQKLLLEEGPWHEPVGHFPLDAALAAAREAGLL